MNHPVNSSLSRHYTFLIAPRPVSATLNTSERRVSYNFSNSIFRPIFFNSDRQSSTTLFSSTPLLHFDARINDNFSSRRAIVIVSYEKIISDRKRSERNARRFDFSLAFLSTEANRGFHVYRVVTRATTYRLLSKRLFLRNGASKRGTTRLRRTNETEGSMSVAMFRPDFNRVFNRQRINSALQSRNIGSLSRRRRNRETRSYYVERLYPFSFSSPSLLSSTQRS